MMFRNGVVSIPPFPPGASVCFRFKDKNDKVPRALFPGFFHTSIETLYLSHANMRALTTFYTRRHLLSPKKHIPISLSPLISLQSHQNPKFSRHFRCTNHRRSEESTSLDADSPGIGSSSSSPDGETNSSRPRTWTVFNTEGSQYSDIQESESKSAAERSEVSEKRGYGSVGKARLGGRYVPASSDGVLWGVGRRGRVRYSGCVPTVGIRMGTGGGRVGSAIKWVQWSSFQKGKAALVARGRAGLRCRRMWFDRGYPSNPLRRSLREWRMWTGWLISWIGGFPCEFFLFRFFIWCLTFSCWGNGWKEREENKILSVRILFILVLFVES